MSADHPFASPRDRLHRREAVARLLAERGDTLVVSGLGGTTWDTFAAGPHDLDFYLWGAMGAAAMIGLGLALAQPRRQVLVITGDGEMLMAAGALATIAVAGPANLRVLVIDNERYGETGQQRSHTSHGIDLAKMAAAAGFAHSMTARTEAELDALAALARGRRGPVFGCVKVSEEYGPVAYPNRHAAAVRKTFRRALLRS